MSNSKIDDIITEFITPLASQVRQLEMQSVSKEHIDELLQNHFTAINNKFKTFNIHELKSLEDKYRKMEVAALNKLLKLQKDNKPIPDSELEHRIVIEIITRSIDQSIKAKREYNRQFSKSHIFEKTLIQTGAISAASPQKKTLEKMKKPNEQNVLMLQIERNTIRPNTYKNILGNTLSSYDAKVLLGLFKIWLNSQRERIVRFQFNDLAHAMNSRPSGGEYKLIFESLNNINNTVLTLKAYMDKKSGIYSAQVDYHPIDRITWIARSKEEDAPGKAREAEVVFGDLIYQNLMAGNYIFMSSVIYNELPTPFARLIYMILLDMLTDNPDFRTFDLDQLIDQLVISGGDEVNEDLANRSRATRQIEAGFDRLIEQDILKSYNVRKQGNRKRWIDFVPSDWIMNQGVQKLM
jgi:hypothetical protein